MSEVIHIIRARTVNKLRKEALALKRLHKIPHHEALDLAARKFDFNNWEHLQKSAAITAISEESFRTGLVIAMDIKDSYDNKPKSNLLVEDDQVFGIFFMDFLTQKGFKSESELDEDQYSFFHDFLINCKFFRYVGQTPNSSNEAFRIAEDNFFHLAEYVWLKGQMYDRYGPFNMDHYF